jgi:nucleoid-associated protein YgaU
MNAGTKLTLAFAALIVISLVVYYTMLSGDDTMEVVMDDPRQPTVEVPEPRVEQQPTPRQVTPPQPTPAPSPRIDTETRPPAANSGRLLGDSVEQALAPQRDLQAEQPPVAARSGEESDSSPLADRAPVVVPEAPRPNDGGKDAPDVSAPAPSDPEDATEDAEESDAADENDAEEVPEQPQPSPAPAAPQPPQYTDYTIKSGDTMSSIARDWFEDESKWDLIAKANPFVDPNRLAVGQVLRLPPKDTEREEIDDRAGAAATTYVVRSGDNLSKIARAYYSDVSQWRIIYEANRELLGNNPNNLRVGMRLVIPPAPQPAED